jgi:hypothetical protein
LSLAENRVDGRFRHLKQLTYVVKPLFVCTGGAGRAVGQLDHAGPTKADLLFRGEDVLWGRLEYAELVTKGQNLSLQQSTAAEARTSVASNEVSTLSMA